MFFNFYPKDLKSLKKQNLEFKNSKDYNSGQKIVWRNVFALSVLHLMALYGLYLWIIAWSAHLQTLIFQIIWALLASFGITAGAHRLWAHRSYNAHLYLRIFYAGLMSMIFANDIYAWVRDHRVHHKFTETNADPHNAKRGLFFSHVGWLLVRRHPEVLSKGAQLSFKDLDDDPVVSFHRKYYSILMPLGTFILPTVIPWYFWNQDNSIYFCVLRYIINIHIVWSLNSFAHSYGMKPYDKNIYATENTIMMYITIGEGFHNYHHVFPWDYKAAEFGNDKRNVTTFVIDIFAKLGWATHLKSASNELVAKKATRSGDGSWKPRGENGLKHVSNLIKQKTDEETFWGWDDPDISPELRKQVLST